MALVCSTIPLCIVFQLYIGCYTVYREGDMILKCRVPSVYVVSSKWPLTYITTGGCTHNRIVFSTIHNIIT